MQNFGSYPMASGGMPSMMGMGAASSGAAGAGPKMMAAGPAVLGGPTDWNSMLRMIAGQRSLPGSGTTGSPRAQALGAEYGGPNANTKVFNPLGTAYTPGIMGGPAQNQPGQPPQGMAFGYGGGMPQMGRPQMPQFNPGQAPQNRPSGMPSAAPVGNMAYTPGIMGGPSQQPGGQRGLPGSGTTGAQFTPPAGAQRAQYDQPGLSGHGRYNYETGRYVAPRFGEPGYGMVFNPGEVRGGAIPGGQNAQRLAQYEQQDAQKVQQQASGANAGSPASTSPDNAAIQNFYKLNPWMLPNPYGHRGGPDQSMIGQYSAMPNGANLLRYFQDGGSKVGPMTVGQMQQYGFR